MMGTKKKKLIIIPYRDEWFKGGNFFFNEIINSFVKYESNSIYYETRLPEDIFNKNDYVAILSFRCHFFEENFNKVKQIFCPIFLFHDDMHKFFYGYPYASRALRNIIQQVKIYFTPYFVNILNFYCFRKFKEKIHWIPWSAPDKLFEGEVHDNWESRLSSAVLSGNMSKIYPLRKIIYKNINKNNNIIMLKPPNYTSNESGLIGQNYYRYLRQFKAAIVTTLFYPINFTVMKYFEIPACGCLGFFENTPDLKMLGFNDMENCIIIDKNNYNERIRIIEGKNKDLKDIAMRGYRLIKNKHKHSDRVVEISSVIIKNL